MPRPRNTQKIQSQTMEVIYNVIEFFEADKLNGAYRYPVDQVIKRAAAATGYAERTIKRIKKMGRLAAANGVKLEAPEKKKRPNLNDLYTEELQYIIGNIESRGELTTVQNILNEVTKVVDVKFSREYLRRILIKRGYIFDPINKNWSLKPQKKLAVASKKQKKAPQKDQQQESQQSEVEQQETDVKPEVDLLDIEEPKIQQQNFPLQQQPQQQQQETLVKIKREEDMLEMEEPQTQQKQQQDFPSQQEPQQLQQETLVIKTEVVDKDTLEMEEPQIQQKQQQYITLQQQPKQQKFIKLEPDPLGRGTTITVTNVVPSSSTTNYYYNAPNL